MCARTHVCSAWMCARIYTTECRRRFARQLVRGARSVFTASACPQTCAQHARTAHMEREIFYLRPQFSNVCHRGRGNFRTREHQPTTQQQQQQHIAHRLIHFLSPARCKYEVQFPAYKQRSVVAQSLIIAIALVHKFIKRRSYKRGHFCIVHGREFSSPSITR